MPVDFPNSPSVNDEFTVGTQTRIWNGTAWILKTSVAQGTQGPTGPQGTGYYNVTSSSSVTPASSGSIQVTTNQQGAFTTGDRVRVLNSSTNYFEGNLTIGTSSTQFIIAADYNFGTTAASNWTIKLAGNRGLQGTQGTQGITGLPVPFRVSSATSVATSLTWNSDNYDEFVLTAQGGNITINADSGTPTNGRRVIFRITDDGTSRNLTWTTGSAKAFRVIGTTLPGSTTANKTVYVGCVYNSDAASGTGRWDVIAVAQEA